MATKSAALKKTATTASTSVALKKPSAANIVSIQEALKAQVALLGTRLAPASGVKIRTTQDKKFILPDGTSTPGPLELVIVDFAAVNNFYDRPYNDKEITPPACFAVGTDPRQMVPSDSSPDKQANDCQSCPLNQWGSNGSGKACTNGRALAVLPPDADADTPIWVLQVSATAIKGFDTYVAGVARSFQSMPVSVVTTVAFDDNVTYAKLVFSDPKPNPNIAEMFGRQAEARELLFAERDVSGFIPISKAPAKKITRR